MKHPLALALFLAVLGLASTAPAALSDFAIKHQITLPGKPGRLVVTPDDRFVLVLQPTAKSIAVVDTWNFSPLGGSISLSGTPVSITLNPEGNTAYVTMTTGKISKISLSSLDALGLNGTLAITATDLSLAFSDSLGDLATVPLGGSTTDSCVFVINGNTLDWFKESAPTTVYGLTPLDCNAREVEGGGKFAFVLCDNPNPFTLQTDLRQYSCTVSGAVNVTITSLALGTMGDFRGLSLAPDKTFLLLGDTVNKKLLLINASPTVVGTDTVGTTPFSIGIKMQEVLATQFAAETGPIAFALDTTDLVLAQGNSVPSAFTGDTIMSLPITGGGFLAQGSTIDRYAYLSLAGGNTLAVVTANPWVEILSVTDADTASAGDTITQGPVTVTFQSDLAGSFSIYIGNSFPPAGTPAKSGSVSGVAYGATVGIDKFSDGLNVITVEVKTSSSSGSYKGRDAVAVSTNLAPVGQNFSLGFGTRKLIITYTVQNRKNLDRQEIYYGTNCGVSLQDYASIDATGNDGKPPSHITIKSPAAGDKISKVVEGVQNGTTYCVQIVTFDAAGRSSISARKSILVAKAFTLTELTGEKGGFNCFGLAGSGQGFRGSGAWLAAVPGMALLLWRIRRRWRRDR
jgi:hypothetical protein